MKHLAVVCLLIGTIAFSVQAANFHVATDGVDEPDRGLSPDLPFRSISYALTVADTTAGRPHVIHIAAGTYTHQTEYYPLPMIDQTTLSGAGPGVTILNAGSLQTNLITAVAATQWVVEEMSLTGGRALQGGAILALHGGPMTLRNLRLYGNRADHPSIPDFQGHGGAIYISDVNGVTLEHLLIHDNSARDDGGAIGLINSAATLNHLTITRNQSNIHNGASALQTAGGLSDVVTLRNSVIWGNGNNPGANLTIAGPHIDAGYSLLETDDTSPYPGTGNVNQDPLFLQPVSQFTVLPGSPVVDIAHPDAPFGNEPEANGGRANAGYYGNTPFAQRSTSDYNLRYNQWAMIGVPVIPPTEEPQLLFGPDFGGAVPSESTWRLSRWNPVTRMMMRYHEPEVGGVDLGDPPPIEPGTGFMIRQRISPTVTLHVPGTALDNRDPLLIDLPVQDRFALHTLANPFPFPVYWSNLRIMTSGGPVSFDQAAVSGVASRYLYVMDGRGALVPSLSILQPWQAGVVLTFNQSAQSVRVPGDRSQPSQGNLLAGMEWGLLLGASAVDGDGVVMGRDAGHLFGVHPQALNGLDPYDAPIIDWTNLSFELRSLPPGADPLFHDVRSPIGSGVVKQWSFQFTSRSLPDQPGLEPADSVEIAFDGFRSVIEDGYVYPPEEYHFWLLDSGYNILIDDLRDSSVVRLPLETVSESERRFRFWVFVGNGTTAVGGDDPDVVQPVGFALMDIYPNPFNATAVIRYRVSKPGEVRMRLFDLLGRQVESQVWHVEAGGVRQRTLDATSLSSGSYFLRLEGEGLANVRRVTLVK